MKTPDEIIRETLDRTIRIETRLTAFLVKHGEPPHNQKPPVWDPVEQAVIVSQLDNSLSSCMSAVPAGVMGDVFIRTTYNQYVATLHME